VDELATQDQKRVLKVTPGNLRQSHIYINGHLDFFPKDCIGSSRRNGTYRPIQLEVQGLDEVIETDIPSDKSSGKPRHFFRGRTWCREFYQKNSVKPGDELTLERIAERRYRLKLHHSNGNGKQFVGKAAEFFAGIGLVRLALERQAWEVVFANDLDPDKAEMYRHNWPNDEHLVVGDIHKLDPKQIPTCDLFTASFPCNDLSIAGRWEGLSGKESSAFWGLIDILRDLKRRKPRYVLLENVVGFLMSHGGKDFRQALLALNELGYTTDAVILNATRWVPQSRQRLFVIARQDEGELKQTFPLVSDARPEALTRFIAANQDIDWNLCELPPLPRCTKKLSDVVEDLPDSDPHWWSQKRAEYFMGQLSSRHEAEARRMIEGKSETYATAFRRVRNGRSMAELRTDGIAGCLRTPRGGSGRQILFKAGKGDFQVRLLTARECARLQGVPDSFRIDVPLNQALFGFGDAVCVPAVEWIIANLIPTAVSK
jgi:DNA (cytosine-5)-methyltransferase 1